MWQRIAFTICSYASLALIMGASTTTVLAQESSVVQSPAITAAAAPEQVRFISFDKINYVRLEVFSPTGERLFDSGFKSGDLLDWGLRDQQGQRLTDGSYLCVVTVKDLSGRLSQRHSLVLLRERQVSLQRVAPEQLSTGEARAWADSRATQALGAAQDSGDLAIAPATMTVATHDGQDGQVTSTSGALTFRTGDVFSGKEQEQMRITPEGRVSIGTDKPEETLDVAGTIHARGGIRFDDGTVLNSAAGFGSKKSPISSNGDAKADGSTPTAAAVAGTGTTGKILKWTDGVNGTAGDSLIAESGGKIGIGIASPQYPLHVANPTFGQFFISGGTAADFLAFHTNAPANARWTGFRSQDGRGKISSFADSGAYRVENILTWDNANGNISLVAAPGAEKLEVSGNLKLIGATSGIIFPDGTKQTTAGSGVSGSGTTGMLPLWSGPTALGNSVITQSAGNIGIGTTGPGSKLTVAGVIESTTGGIKFPDGTVQMTVASQGPAGPQGAQGPQGATGPQGPQGARGPEGPAVHTSAVCASAFSNTICVSNSCSCPGGAVSIVFSPCTVTSDTGTCSATSCGSSRGQCCVCRP